MRWLTLLLLLVAGCSGPLQFRGPSVSTSVEPNGVHVQLDTHLGENIRQLNPPTLQYKDRYDQWIDVDGDGITIPGTQGSMDLKLNLNGRTVSAEATYDGRLERIDPSCWTFNIRNYRDGGLHPLYIRIIYQNIGQGQVTYATPYTMPFKVYNQHGY